VRVGWTVSLTGKRRGEMSAPEAMKRQDAFLVLS